MAYQNELTEIALKELKLHGIKGATRDTNGNHIEIAWQACPEKEVRRIFAAKTPSDWRSRMNIRSEVRKFLRADNVPLVLQHKPKSKPAPMEKALSLPPTDIIPVPDQVATLSREVADLTELVLKLTKIVSGVRDKIDAYVPPPPKPVVVQQSSRSIKLVEYLSHDKFVSVAALVRDTGLSKKQVDLKLYYLKTHGQIEMYQGGARLKPPKPETPKALNGHHAPKKRGRPRTKNIHAPAG